MDRDGVWAQVIYGPPTGLLLQDGRLLAACEQVYNDWTVEFNAVSPNRLVALPLISANSPAEARAEMVRVAGLGHPAACCCTEAGRSPPSSSRSGRSFGQKRRSVDCRYTSTWAVACTVSGPRGSWRQPAMVSVVPMQMDEILAGMIFSGILERHPNMTVVLGESGLGWIPYVLERMDHEYHKYYDRTEDVRLSSVPSEFFHRQMIATYEEDELGLESVHRIGPDNIMWASDYPHGRTPTRPHTSWQAIEKSPLSRLDAATQRKILWGTAARIYQIA